MINGSPASHEIFLTVRWLWGLSSRLSNSDLTVSTFSSVHARRLPLPGRLSTVPNFTSSLLMLFFLQPLFRNYVIKCQALQPLHSYRFLIKMLSPLLNSVKVAALLDTASKFVLFSVSGLKDEKFIKTQTYIKTETRKLYSRDFWICVPNIVKIDPYIFELYRFKLGRFETFW